MKRKIFLALGGIGGFVLGCGGGGGLSGADGTLAEFNTVIFSSTSASVQPNTVPLLNAQTRQIPQLQSQRACIGDANNNGRCDADENQCQTCAQVPVGTPCDGGGDFRTVCCANVNVCFGEPTSFTITFGFRSTPLFDASGGSLPRPTSPVLIQGYSAVFSYSQGCPAGLPTADSGPLSGVVPAPQRGGESSAQVSITYNTQPWLTQVPVSNVCMTTTLTNFRLPPSFTSSVCDVNAVFNFNVMEQFTGKRKTISVPVRMQIIPKTGDCVP